MRRTAITIVCLAIAVIAVEGYFTWRRSSNSTGPATGAEPSLLLQLPPATPYVFYADVAALRNAAFLSKLVAMVPAPAEDPEYTEFVQATGFDYSRDLDRVAISAAAGTSATGASQSGVWVMAEGRFDPQKIQAYVLRSGKIEQRDGHTFYVIDSGTSADEVSLRFISPGRIEIVSRTKQTATGNSELSNSTQNGSPAPAPADPLALRERIARVSGSTVFAVTRTDSVPKNLMLGNLKLDAITSAIENVHWMSLAANPEGENLRVILEGECGSALESTKLQLTLVSLRMIGRGLLSEPGTRRQFTPQGAAALDKLARQIEISREGPRVRVTAVLSPDMLTGFAAPPPAQSPIAAPAQKRAPAGN